MSQGSALPPPDQKSAYVRRMFGRIARRYDLMNRLMTLGRDRAWRRHTVRTLNLPSWEDNTDSKSKVDSPRSNIVLDVATGTGDLALEVLRRQAGALVVGLDFTPEMLALAQAKAARGGGTGMAAQSSGPKSGSGVPVFVAADALRLPFPSELFDGIVTGFALRNVTDIPAAFAEMARVTRPGARVACLEIAKPRLAIFRSLFTLYFYRVVPLIGGLVSGQRSAYTYLPHSLTAFLTPDEIAEVMRRTGWRDVRYRRLMLGTVAVHEGTK